MLNNNYGILSGIVTEKFHLEYSYNNVNYYFGMLGIKRNSGVFDLIPICIPSFAMPEEDISSIELRDFLEIHGTFRSRNEIFDKKNKLLLRFYAIPNDKQKAVIVHRQEIAYKNDITLIGNICKPVITRVTPKGLKISDILVACNRKYNSDYIPTICWGYLSDQAKLLNVGDKVQILGRIQSREYTKQNEEVKRIALEVSAMKLHKIEVE